MKTILYSQDAGWLYQKIVEVSGLDVLVGSEIEFGNNLYVVNRIVFNLDKFEKIIYLTKQE
jgi:hypothetical protein